MGKIMSSVLGANNDFQADNGGQNYGNLINGANANYNQSYKDQQGLAQMLMQQANGQGPNPAQAMLNQATDQGIKQNAALLASSKGINPALAQRLAAENQANMHQEAAGQAATMNAQQRLAAQGQLGGLYGQMGTQALQSQGLAQGALNSANAINSGVSAQNATTSGQLAGGLLNGFGALGSMSTTGGGGGGGSSKGGLMSMLAMSDGGQVPGSAQVSGDSQQNDTVHTMLSPGEIVIPRSKTSDPDKAKAFIDQIMKEDGGSGEKEVHYGHVLELKRRIAHLEKKVGKK